MLHTVLALPSCNVGLQYYSLHFTQTAIKTIMVHSIAPCNFFLNASPMTSWDTKFQQHSGACVANSTFKLFPQCTHIYTIILYWYHIYLDILRRSCTHMKPCLHIFSNPKGIFNPHIPAVKKGVIVSTQLCYLYGLGEMFHVVNLYI